jgi:hypothetical protein
VNVIKANIIDLYKIGAIVCVTTNGYIKKNGRAVMGRGNALAMATLYSTLPDNLAAHIKKNGNVVGPILNRVISFPVKPAAGTYDQVLDKIKYMYKPGQKIPGYHCKADLKLIERSLDQLNEFINKYNLEEVYLPLPGCSNGELKFEDIEYILKKGSDKIIYCSL